jgi:MoaA/NifB/PqqE/SkfB family radical SAM enzyme
MLIPNYYNYIALFLTMRCTYNCSYCINWKLPYKEQSGYYWIDNLNKLDTDLSITIGGGEPTVHKDFYKIIRGLRHKVEVLTNLSFDVKEFASELTPSMFNTNRLFAPIRVSFHSEFMDVSTTITKLDYLINKGFKIGLYCVDTDENKPAIELFKRLLTNQSGCTFETKPLLDNTIKQKPKQDKFVLCRTKELLLAPNGNIFRCHRDLYKNENVIDNIATVKELSTDFRTCNNYLECHPCDTKIKRDRFGNQGYCAIEKLEK